jgi:hypothetical protein
VTGKRVKEGDSGDGVWSHYIYLYETEVKKPLATALSGVGRGLRDDRGKVNNRHYKTNWNCQCESPP